MHNITISLDSDMADQFMLAVLRNTGDTAIWCIREAHKSLANGGGSHNWSDIGDNLKILGAVNELLEYYGGTPLDLATHKTGKFD
jgi:hypothetical protein